MAYLSMSSYVSLSFDGKILKAINVTRKLY